MAYNTPMYTRHIDLAKGRRYLLSGVSSPSNLMLKRMPIENLWSTASRNFFTPTMNWLDLKEESRKKSHLSLLKINKPIQQNQALHKIKHPTSAYSKQ